MPDLVGPGNRPVKTRAGHNSRALYAKGSGRRSTFSRGPPLHDQLDTLGRRRKGIAPGQFQDFGLSVGVPEGKVGSKLTFKALQYYEGGEVVRWIGQPDADKPAAQVTLLAAEEEYPLGVLLQCAARWPPPLTLTTIMRCRPPGAP